MTSGPEGCSACKEGEMFELPITMAFQPIVDSSTTTVFGYEALVRGIDGSGAASVLKQVTPANRYGFDQRCRTTAIELASGLGLADLGAFLSINFLPNAVYEPRACIRETLKAAERFGFPLDRIIFEFTEHENVDAAHVLKILHAYRAIGFRTAIDDFGAGYAGLNLLAQFQPDFVKIDMDLIRGVHESSVKQAIVRNALKLLDDLGIRAICEGIETKGERAFIGSLGVQLMQGYLFAKPSLGQLPAVLWPSSEPAFLA